MSTVLAEQRRRRIAEQVRQREVVRVTELASQFQVSDMTIRRDLDVLARQGVVEKVHGGALAPWRSAEEPGFDVKQGLQQAEKEAIATVAASMVPPGSSVALSGGTTTWTLAGLLRHRSDVTVVTNSLEVAERLHGAGPAGRVVVTGGSPTPSRSLVGPLADATIRSLYVDLLFLGVHGLDQEAGLTTPNLAEAETDRALLDHAGQVIVLADHAKWGTVGLGRIAGLDRVGTLVTDWGIPDRARQVLAREIRRVLVAQPLGGEG